MIVFIMLLIARCTRGANGPFGGGGAMDTAWHFRLVSFFHYYRFTSPLRFTMPTKHHIKSYQQINDIKDTKYSIIKDATSSICKASSNNTVFL